MNVTVINWNIGNVETLGQFQECLRSYINRELEVDWEDAPPTYSVNNVNGFDYNNIYELKIEDTTFRYIIFNIAVERAKSENNWHNANGVLKERRDRISLYQSNMLVYELNGELRILTLAAKTTVTKIFRHAFDNEAWGDITEINYGISEDMFYWLLKRLRDYPRHFLYNNINVGITGLLSYLGKTDDGNNAFRANGRRVLAVLGTLAFIFSSERLKALRPEFQHNGNVFVVELNLNNSFKIYEEYYCGNLNVYRGQEKINALVLYVINILIPRVIQSYNRNIEDNLWSNQFKLDFLESIGTEIMERVQEELEQVRDEIDEFNGEVIDEVDIEDDELIDE